MAPLHECSQQYKLQSLQSLPCVPNRHSSIHAQLTNESVSPILPNWPCLPAAVTAARLPAARVAALNVHPFLLFPQLGACIGRFLSHVSYRGAGAELVAKHINARPALTLALGHVACPGKRSSYLLCKAPDNSHWAVERQSLAAACAAQHGSLRIGCGPHPPLTAPIDFSTNQALYIAPARLVAEAIIPRAASRTLPPVLVCDLRRSGLGESKI